MGINLTASEIGQEIVLLAFITISIDIVFTHRVKTKSREDTDAFEQMVCSNTFGTITQRIVSLACHIFGMTNSVCLLGQVEAYFTLHTRPVSCVFIAL